MTLDRSAVVESVTAALEAHAEWLATVLERLAAIPDAELSLDAVVAVVQDAGSAAVRNARAELRDAEQAVVFTRLFATLTGTKH